MKGYKYTVVEADSIAKLEQKMNELRFIHGDKLGYVGGVCYCRDSRHAYELYLQAVVIPEYAMSNDT